MLDQHLQIIEALGVAKEFDASAEAERRTAFLANYMQASSCGALVLGISGGVDSLRGTACPDCGEAPPGQRP